MRLTAAAAATLIALVTLHASEVRVPTVKLSSAPRLVLPGDIDSSSPLVWDTEDGLNRLFLLTSWGGVPARSSGAGLEQLQQGGPVTIEPHPGHGVWIEAVVSDGVGTWYGYYHHERPALECGREDRQLLNIGAARSTDHGRTWENLGIVVDAPPESTACQSMNRFVLGGVGDVAAVLDADGQNLYLYFSEYERDPKLQGVAVARLAWADRDDPVGKVMIWNNGAWLPVGRGSPTPVRSASVSDVGSGDFDAEDPKWIYPPGTPLVPATRPFHDASPAADVFWGASIHWNTYLEQYVMFLNRARDDRFNNEGIYVSFAPALDDPRQWSVPQKVMNGGGWYPQVIGLEAGGTDRLAGKRARFFLTGKSEQMVEFER